MLCFVLVFCYKKCDETQQIPNFLSILRLYLFVTVLFSSTNHVLPEDILKMRIKLILYQIYINR